VNAPLSRRAFLRAQGALIVALANSGRGFRADPGCHPARPPHVSSIRPSVDAYFALHQDGSVTLYCGKVDLGTGLRVAIPQMAAEELGLPLDRIKLIEGDTALTPDQGSTSGSTGIARGGVQIRQAAATVREGLVAEWAPSARFGRRAKVEGGRTARYDPKVGEPGFPTER